MKVRQHRLLNVYSALTFFDICSWIITGIFVNGTASLGSISLLVQKLMHSGLMAIILLLMYQPCMTCWMIWILLWIDVIDWQAHCEWFAPTTSLWG